jgi:hypothetical protein
MGLVTASLTSRAKAANILEENRMMQQRKIGHSGITVSALGLGCMGMSEFYG